MLAVIHLSDIHIKENPASNPILDRAQCLADAIAAETRSAKQYILIVSGDIAYSGQKKEYEIAKKFFAEIEQRLKHNLNRKIGRFYKIAVPGNHDCDFSGELQARDYVLEQISVNKSLQPSTIELCCQPQENYREFARDFTDVDLSVGLSKLHDEVKIACGSQTISVQLLNTAWMSKLHEKQGSLQLPVPSQANDDQPSADLAISVLHHPYKWIEATNANALRRYLDRTSDLVLTGHEHESSRYSKSIGDQQIDDYIEGGVLQESNDPDFSEFSVVLIDFNKKKKKCTRFGWDQANLYRPNEADWEPFNRNAKRMAHAYEFTDAHLSWLFDPGVSFTHPRKDPIELDDIYVFPDLKKLQDSGDGSASPLVRSADYYSLITKTKKLFVLGEDSDGRTCLGKYTFRLLHSKGIIPLTLTGSQIRKAVPVRLEDVAKTQFYKQYKNCDWDRYRQLPRSQRALIIDEFEDLPRSAEYYTDLIKQIDQEFDIVILYSNKSIELGDIYDSGELLVPLKDYKYFEISPFGHLKRHDLIRKWYLLGRKNQLSTENHERKLGELEEFVSEILGRDLIRPVPLVVLTILQQIDAGNESSTIGGSFGQIYDHLVNARLCIGSLSKADVSTRLAFLSFLAYKLFQSEASSFNEELSEEIEEEFKTKRYVDVDSRLIIKESIQSGILRQQYGQFEFKHSYYFAYFVAKYIADHIGRDPKIDGLVQELSSKLFLDDIGNIFLFLTHLSPSELPIEHAVRAANSLFGDSKEISLGKDIAFINTRLKDILTAPRLEEKQSTKENRRVMLAERDKAEESPDSSRLDASESHESAAELNAALRTIKILGQVLRDRAADLDGKRKEEILDAAVSLSRRSLGYTFDRFENGDTNLVAIFQKIIEEHGLGDPRRSRMIAERIVAMLLVRFSYCIIKHLSAAVGSEQLKPLYDHKLKHSEESPPFISLVSASIRLDHCTGFPEVLVTDISKALAKNHFALGILRQSVWMRFYLFPAPVDMKQRVCERLEIPYNNQLFLNPKTKQSTKLLTSSKDEASMQARKRRRGRKKDRSRRKRGRK